MNKGDMTRRLLALAYAAAAIAACRARHEQPGSAGAVPAIWMPIGPVPGPATAGSGPSNPYAGDAAATMEGRHLFDRYNCSGCHGTHAGGGMGPSLRDDRWIYGSTEANIFSSIAEGRAHGMPSWGTKIPDDQVWKLVAYVKSLRTPNEPDPPR